MAWFRRKKKEETPPVMVSAPVAWMPGGTPAPAWPPPGRPQAPPPPLPAAEAFAAAAAYPPSMVPAPGYAAAPAQPSAYVVAPGPLVAPQPLGAPVPAPEEPWPPPMARRPEPPLPPGVPDIKFERFRHGVPHVEISTTNGATLVVTPAHPLFEEFVQWGSAWAQGADEPRVFRVHPENLRLRGVKPPPRGKVRRTV